MFKLLFKITFLILGSLIMLNESSAQDTIPKSDTIKVWKKSGKSNLNFSQVGLKNWVGGGQNSLSITAIQSLYLGYDKPAFKWTNQLDLGFGLLRQGRDPKFYKSDDKVVFISKASRKLKHNVFTTALADFRTQMAPGYEYNKDTTGELRKKLLSRFLSPGYLLATVGFEYKAGSVFYLYASPLSSKFTFVTDDSLSAQGAFGIDKGEHVRKEFGAYLNMGVLKKLAPNVSLDTKLSLFSNYQTFGNIDVNWELLLLMKVNKYLATTISTQLLYDDDINITRENGTIGPDLQVKEVVNVGLLYQY